MYVSKEKYLTTKKTKNYTAKKIYEDYTAKIKNIWFDFDLSMKNTSNSKN